MKKLNSRAFDALIKAAEQGSAELILRNKYTYRIIVGMSVNDELIVIVNTYLGIRLGCITQQKSLANKKLILEWINFLIDKTEKQKGN